jgi:DNA gyrase/topoisomerase IV subunit B
MYVGRRSKSGEFHRLLTEIVENEIRTHFRLKAASIREQMAKWAEIDDGRAITGDSHPLGPVVTDRKIITSFKQAVTNLETLLDRLEGTGEPLGGGNGTGVEQIDVEQLACTDGKDDDDDDDE